MTVARTGGFEPAHYSLVTAEGSGKGLGMTSSHPAHPTAAERLCLPVARMTEEKSAATTVAPRRRISATSCSSILRINPWTVRCKAPTQSCVVSLSVGHRNGLLGPVVSWTHCNRKFGFLLVLVAQINGLHLAMLCCA